MTHREHEVVVLNRDLPEHGLRAGDVGAVVHVYPEAKAYEVEFVNGSGATVALETLEPEDLRSLDPEEILHCRRISAA